MSPGTLPQRVEPQAQERAGAAGGAGGVRQCVNAQPLVSAQHACLFPGISISFVACGSRRCRFLCTSAWRVKFHFILFFCGTALVDERSRRVSVVDSPHLRSDFGRRGVHSHYLPPVRLPRARRYASPTRRSLLTHITPSLAARPYLFLTTHLILRLARRSRTAMAHSRVKWSQRRGASACYGSTSFCVRVQAVRAIGARTTGWWALPALAAAATEQFHHRLALHLRMQRCQASSSWTLLKSKRCGCPRTQLGEGVDAATSAQRRSTTRRRQWSAPRVLTSFSRCVPHQRLRGACT